MNLDVVDLQYEPDYSKPCTKGKKMNIFHIDRGWQTKSFTESQNTAERFWFCTERNKGIATYCQVLWHDLNNVATLPPCGHEMHHLFLHQQRRTK